MQKFRKYGPIEVPPEGGICFFSELLNSSASLIPHKLLMKRIVPLRGYELFYPDDISDLTYLFSKILKEAGLKRGTLKN